MEANLAKDGSVHELRQWLKAHPERVNVPIRPANFTLLYLAILGLSRCDVLSIQQGRPNRYDETIHMLCEEFGADPDAPNGGEGNTAVHLAAETNDAFVLTYLVCKRKAKLSPNRYGETPLAYAQRKSPDSECVSILQREVDLRESYKQRADATEQSRQQEEINLRSLRHRLNLLKVEDSDGDSEEEAATRNTSGKRDAVANLSSHAVGTGVGSSSSLLSPPQPSSTARHTATAPTPLGMGPRPAGSPLNGSYGLPRQSTSPLCKGVGAPPPAAPRRERDISNEPVFKEKDLDLFRQTFGNGFTYLECEDHYEIRGLLPYKFKGSEYFTPVIISMYRPQRSLPQLKPPSAGAGLSDGVTSATFTGPDGDAQWHVSYSRYRAVLDFERMNDFAISRKAEYIDPLSGAIMPSSSDAMCCTSLVSFVRQCIIENFERTAPMVTKVSAYAFDVRPSLAVLESPVDLFRHHHSSNAPAYLQNVLRTRDHERVWAYRLLQDLSRFGDGLFNFDRKARSATGVIPIYSERGSDSDVLVLTVSPTTRKNADTSFPSTQPNRADANHANPENTASKTRPIDTELVFAVRTMIYFPAPNEGDPAKAFASPRGFPDFPRFYLRDCCDPATRQLTDPSRGDGFERSYAKANFLCFRPLLENTATGLLRQDVLQPCVDHWLLAQKAALARAIEKDRKHKTPLQGGAGAAPPPVPVSANGELCDMLTVLQKKLTSTLQEFIDGYRRSPTRRAAASNTSTQLDAFFADAANSSTSSSSVAGGLISSSEGSGKRCLICFKNPKSIVFQPCRHSACCSGCAQRLENHARESCFSCPVCRTRVQEVQEIYL